MPQPIIPWEPSVFPSEITQELDRRKNNRSFTYTQWGKNDWEKYKGPMSPWVRFCSNGMGPKYEKDRNGKDKVDPTTKKLIPLPTRKEGFVLCSGKNFYSDYGFTKTGTNEGIVGYLPNGEPHTIANDLATSNHPIHVPPPEIQKIEVSIQKELFRRASVEWICFSKRQLEYMTPYFLVPGITCILEWGWNHFDTSTLLDLTDISQLKKYNDNPYPLYTDHILKSNGNYDVLFGRVTNFEWTMDGNKIRCKTEITSQDRIYAGIVSNASAVVRTEAAVQGKPDPEAVALSSLSSFVKTAVNKLRDVITTPPDKVMPEFYNYLLSQKKDNYIYGIYQGRNHEVPSSIVNINVNTNTGIGGGGFVGAASPTSTNSRKSNIGKDDWDRKSNNKHLWLNLGLVMEMINYSASPLTGVQNKEIFRVDIDDCVIGGHPNLISTDGDILLIPNTMAPHYFYTAIPSEVGVWATMFDGFIDTLTRSRKFLPEEMDRLAAIKKEIIVLDSKPKTTREENRKRELENEKKSLIDGEYTRNFQKTQEEREKLLKDCDLPVITKQNNSSTYSLPYNKRYTRVLKTLDVRRDDHDKIINELMKNSKRPMARVSSGIVETNTEFPFKNDVKIRGGFKEYPEYYSGYLKNLYFNAKRFEELVSESKTYVELIERILEDITKAAGNFWNFRLVGGVGRDGHPPEKPAPLKISDYNFPFTANRGSAYTFDYMDADSLLLGMDFKPTLSSAQAIRTIYAPINNPNRNIQVTNGESELLDYQFEDRLQEGKIAVQAKPPMENLSEVLESLRTVRPTDKMFQVTEKNIIYRLVMPQPSVLSLLLDDGDEENNPKYTGIMPGIQSSFTIQGIGGLRTFMCFLVRNLPEPYSHQNIIFRITDVKEILESGKWTTTIIAGIMPYRKHIRDRLGIET